MADRRPLSLKNEKKKILIICEGQEDQYYLEKLKRCHVWSDEIQVDTLDAASNTKLYQAYRDNYIGSYDLLLIFCDTELAPYENLISQMNKINDFFNGENVAPSLFYFVNPVTMQLIIMHKDYVMLDSNQKSDYAPIIEKYFGVKGYSAHRQQLNDLLKQIDASNYQDMVARVSNISSEDYTKVNSTNILKLFSRLESGETNWIDELSDKLASSFASSDGKDSRANS